MANAVPTTTSHQGASGGMDKASSHAVRSAVLSLRKKATGLFWIFSISASTPSAVMLASVSEIRIAGP